MVEIPKILSFIEKQKLKYEETFRSIDLDLTENKELLLKHDFWVNLNEKIDYLEFTLGISLKNKETKNEFTLQVKENFEITRTEDIKLFASKIPKLMSVKDVDISKKEIFKKLQEEIKKEILNSKTHSLTNLFLIIRKIRISNYIHDQYDLSEAYKLCFWSSLDKFNGYMKSANLLDLSENLIEKGKIVAIIVPNNNIYFSNFFEIISLDKIAENTKDLNKNKIKVDLVKDLLSNYKIETEFVENTPIFPIAFENIKIDELTEKYWLSYSRIIMYTIYSIISEKVSIISEDKNEFELSFVYNPKQRLNFIHNEISGSLIVGDLKKEDNSYEYTKEKIIEIVTRFVNMGYFSGIGTEREIRNYSIEKLQKTEFRHLNKLYDFYEELITQYSVFKRNLIEGKIADLKKSTEFIEKSLRTIVTDVTKATTKVTQEITKSFLTSIGSTAVTVLGYVLDNQESNLMWFYRILAPLVGLAFAAIFLTEICTTRKGVLTQINLYVESRDELEEKIGKRKELRKLEKQLWAKRDYFIIVFRLIIVLFSILVCFIGYAIFIVNTSGL
ncbi:MAG: hypothetical protein GNW80_09295 [Asgard group archaeon]|nr:hypothetical protein [Asgard group archaeon]